uniref:C2H2-type domain-containing protein n=1 Tax=Panthera leo TaxID=9689 RepID=A0A8C8Y8X4_PANLE
ASKGMFHCGKTFVLSLQIHVFFFCEEKHLFKCEFDGYCKRFAMKHCLMRHAVVYDRDKKKMKIKIRTFHEESSEYIPSERKHQQIVWCCFVSPNWCVPDKVPCSKVSKFAKLQTVILPLNVLVSKVPLLYSF